MAGATWEIWPATKKYKLVYAYANCDNVMMLMIVVVAVVVVVVAVVIA